VSRASYFSLFFLFFFFFFPLPLIPPLLALFFLFISFFSVVRVEKLHQEGPCIVARVGAGSFFFFFFFSRTRFPSVYCLSRLFVYSMKQRVARRIKRGRQTSFFSLFFFSPLRTPPPFLRSFFPPFTSRLTFVNYKRRRKVRESHTDVEMFSCFNPGPLFFSFSSTPSLPVVFFFPPSPFFPSD